MNCKSAKDIIESYASSVKLSNYSDAFDTAIAALEFTNTIKALANISDVTSTDVKILYERYFSE